MTPEETTKLVDTALKGIHPAVPDLESYTEFMAARYVSKSLAEIIKAFTILVKDLFKTYKLKTKADELNPKDSLALLFTVRNMRECVIYYSKEKENVDEKIALYRDYLLHPEDFNFGQEEEKLN